MEGKQIERYPMWVSDNFFEFLPYELISGKADEVFKQDFSAVISRSFAERYFPGENPVGKTIKFDYDGTMMRSLIITGIFKDVKNTQILNTDILVNERLIPSIETRGGWRSAANLVRFHGNPDIIRLAHDIYYNSSDEFFKSRLSPELKFTRFDKLDVNIGYPDPFRNLSDLKQQKRFISACVILLIFSLLNYIFLSFAFSRFRIKEMATKMILGTSGKRITMRLIAESLLLTSVSFAIGVLIAVALEKHVSLLLSSDVKVFSRSLEFIWSLIVIIVCSVSAAAIPAFGMARIKPAEVLKGENIFVMNETLKWVKAQGGLEKVYEMNKEKAALLYNEIDRNPLFRGTAAKEDRSLMNICFVMAEGYEHLQDEFFAFAKERGMVGIKGHRSVGGFRASTYNACPKEAVEALVACMQEFEQLHK